MTGATSPPPLPRTFTVIPVRRPSYGAPLHVLPPRRSPPLRRHAHDEPLHRRRPVPPCAGSPAPEPVQVASGRLAATTPDRDQLNRAPDGPSAVTLHCARAGISERRPLRMRHASSARFTAATGDERALLNRGETSALALALDLTPRIRPGPMIVTRVTLSFHFVREPWWPRDLTDAMIELADSWLRHLEEQPHATARSHQTIQCDRATQPGPSPFSRQSPPRQVPETWHL